MDLFDVCKAENVELLINEDKTKIFMRYDGQQVSSHYDKNPQSNIDFIEYYLDVIRAERFYKSDEYKAEFNKQLEIAILATRGGGSGARACRDTLLSLYNGNVYKADLSGWYNLDNTNRKALLYILEHHTFNHAKAIDQYILQYQGDFERMKKEVSEIN